MSTLWKPNSKLAKLARILQELDTEQSDFDRHDTYSAEDIRWARIFISKAMASINTQCYSKKTLDNVRTNAYKDAS